MPVTLITSAFPGDPHRTAEHDRRGFGLRSRVVEFGQLPVMSKTMRRTIAAACVAASLFGVRAADAQAHQDRTLTVSVNGVTRIAYLHAPANVVPETKLPLVIGYHGGAGTAE